MGNHDVLAAGARDARATNRAAMRASVRMGLVALVACGRRHAKTGGGDGSGASCTVDSQCSAAKCCANVCVATADCAFAVTSVQPATGFVNGGDWVQLAGAGFAPGM